MRTSLNHSVYAAIAACMLASCGQGTPIADEAIEQQIENAAAAQGQNVDVEIDSASGGATYSVTTDEGTAQIGNNLALPAGFPDDVALYPAMVIFASGPADGGFVLQASATATLADVAAFYNTEMAALGWTAGDQAMQADVMQVLGFEKDGRTVSVNIMQSQPDVIIQIAALPAG